MNDLIAIAPEDLRERAAAALSAAGAAPAHAAATADILVEGDLMGLGTHGVLRLLTYCERLRLGGINARAEIDVERRAPSLAVVDGDDGLGPAVAMAALDAGFAMAEETGIAYLGCRRSHHLGALAPYGLKACERGFVLACGTNASPTIAPWGGREARLGNNPLSIAAPCPDAPHFILDMAMSVAARGKIRKALDEGGSIPEGWAVDAAGRPTTDPAAALGGFLLPFGGHKGSGLSQAVDLLSAVLSGVAAPGITLCRVTPAKRATRARAGAHGRRGLLASQSVTAACARGTDVGAGRPAQRWVPARVRLRLTWPG
jgi:LDH2 family malate/lactate/ureidoglycolate dehydrogenase